MKRRLLFICLGNICRSPSAEAIMKKKIEEKGLRDDYYIDSAGISGWHTGEESDRRMQQHAEKRGINLTSRSRKFYPDHDFEQFDMIIGMDEQNINDLSSLASDRKERSKIYKMTDFCLKHTNIKAVPDPYYGGDKGFELVLDILDDACEGLLQFTQNKNTN